MPVVKRSIYRDSAIEHYGQNREKNVSLRFVSLRSQVILWVVLGVLLVLGLLSWSAQVPLYMKGSGIVLNKVNMVHVQGDSLSGGGEAREEGIAAVFLPFSRASKVHVGLSVRIRLGTAGPQLESTISEVVPGAISPYSACNSYGLAESCSHIITQPSVVAIVNLGTSVPVGLYSGSVLTAEVEIGTQRILPLLWGGNRSIGE